MVLGHQLGQVLGQHDMPVLVFIIVVLVGVVDVFGGHPAKNKIRIRLCGLVQYSDAAVIQFLDCGEQSLKMTFPRIHPPANVLFSDSAVRKSFCCLQTGLVFNRLDLSCFEIICYDLNTVGSE